MVEASAASVAVPALAFLGVGALLLSRRQGGREPPAVLLELTAPPIDPGTTVRAARRLNRAAGTLATSVLADSAVEHYRGSFQNPAMFAPLIASALSLMVSVHGGGDKRPTAHRLRDGVYAAAALTGLIGTAFHIFNIRKKPGGFSWQNLFWCATTPRESRQQSLVCRLGA
jgi:hypothetical protein